jgi:hypothetical protein
MIVELSLWETVGMTIPNVRPVERRPVIASGDCLHCGKPMMVLDRGDAYHLNGDVVDVAADDDHVAHLPV